MSTVIYYRVIIIGAGPAGSAAAILLSRAGHSVTLIEQHRFPRDKVCGECISPLGIDVLTRLGAIDQLRALGPTMLTRAILRAGSTQYAVVPLPRTMWGLSRRVLDAGLLDSARDAGATILQPVRVESIRRNRAEGDVLAMDEADHRSRPAVTVRDLANNRVESIPCDLILLADGKGALLPHRPSPTDDLGIKAHFRDGDLPTDAIHLFALDGYYAGLAPIEGGVANLAFSIPAARVASAAGDLDAIFDAMLCQSPAMRRMLAHATRVGPWLASPLPRHPVSRNWPRGVIPLGNAAAALEPIGGEGMGLALASAQAACQQILSGSIPPPVRPLQRSFNTLWQRRRLACRAFAMAFSNRSAAPFIVKGAETFPGLVRIVLRMTGKARPSS